MEQKRELAIVLRSVPYEERHRIVTALTENHGQLTGMARNAIQSRRFGGSLDAFAASEWSFSRKPGAELVMIEQAQSRRSFEGLRKNFESLSLASVFGELMLKLAPKDEPAPELFRLHSNALAVLDELPAQAESNAHLALLNAYLSKLLQWNGSQPRLLSCLSCSKALSELGVDTELSCLIADAGWVCAECRGKSTRHLQQGMGIQLMLRLSPAAVLDFHQALAQPLRQAHQSFHSNLKQNQDLFKFLETLIVYHVPGFDRRPLKALRFLDVESAWAGL